MDALREARRLHSPAQYAQSVRYQTKRKWLQAGTAFFAIFGVLCILSSVGSFADSDITGLSLYTGAFGILAILVAVYFYVKTHEPPTS